MNNIYVASGDYIIASSESPQLLVALLATCVGLAVFDRKAKIGGICHVLLPRPNDPANVWHPRKYASSALPLFIDELLQAGAHRENLEAVVAGGSLYSPVSSRDIFLNIGGLNLESTFLFLERHAIPVRSSETGGCNGMKLTYNSENCRVEIQHSIHFHQQSNSFQPVQKAPEDKEILAAIAATKPIPQTALKLIRLIKSEDYNLRDIVAELNSDQVLSAKLLSYCNSAFFGFRTRIDSVQKAISLIGETYLLEAIITAAVNSFFEQEKPGGYALIKGGLFKHSICVAYIARAIAATSGREDKDTAYTAGLMHDIGKLVLDTFVAGAQPHFYSSEEEEFGNLIQLEQKIFNCDHQTVGRQLADTWKLPENLRDAISFHHVPENAAKAKTLTGIIFIADVVASFFMAGMKIDKINLDLFDQRLDLAGLKKNELPIIIEQIPWEKIMYA